MPLNVVPDGNVLFYVLAGILAIVCSVCTYFYHRTKRLLDEIWAVDTYDSRELARMCKGGFDATVEVQGNVSCDNPLISFAAGVPCCWFHTVVEREDETTEVVEDSDGHRHTETKRSWVVSMDRTHGTVFKVTDSTGFTLVDPTRAEIDSQTVRDEIVYGQEPWFEGVMMSDTGRYKIKEQAFLPSGYAFVLGRATESPDGIMLHWPQEGYADSKSRFFLISRKTEAELTKSKQSKQTILFWVAILSGLAVAASLMAARGWL